MRKLLIALLVFVPVAASASLITSSSYTFRAAQSPVRHRREIQNAGWVTPRREWWSMLDLNQRPPACEAGALPTELIDRVVGFYALADTASTERGCDVPENARESF